MKKINHIHNQPTCKKGGPMPVQGKVVEDEDGNLAIEIKEEEKKKDKKTYEQLQFEFEDYTLTEDQVAPI